MPQCTVVYSEFWAGPNKGRPVRRCSRASQIAIVLWRQGLWEAPCPLYPLYGCKAVDFQDYCRSLEGMMGLGQAETPQSLFFQMFSSFKNDKHFLAFVSIWLTSQVGKKLIFTAYSCFHGFMEKWLCAGPHSTFSIDAQPFPWNKQQHFSFIIQTT